MRVSLTLASSSPRRRELLARLGVTFEVADPGVDEAPQPGEAAAALARRLAVAKAAAVRSAAGGYVLGADTLVVCGEHILGKPADLAAAEAAAFVARIVGSYTNVVGLPLAETAGLLAQAGLLP